MSKKSKLMLIILVVAFSCQAIVAMADDQPQAAKQESPKTAVVQQAPAAKVEAPTQAKVATPGVQPKEAITNSPVTTNNAASKIEAPKTMSTKQPPTSKAITAKGATTNRVTTAKRIAKTHMVAANMVAVCACGKAFVPDAGTKYFSYNGKEYATCSDACYEKALKDPATSAHMAEANFIKMMQPVTSESK